MARLPPCKTPTRVAVWRSGTGGRGSRCGTPHYVSESAVPALVALVATTVQQALKVSRML
jgi:hypothetical protein